MLGWTTFVSGYSLKANLKKKINWQNFIRKLFMVKPRLLQFIRPGCAAIRALDSWMRSMGVQIPAVVTNLARRTSAVDMIQIFAKLTAVVMWRTIPCHKKVEIPPPPLDCQRMTTTFLISARRAFDVRINITFIIYKVRVLYTDVKPKPKFLNFIQD